MTTALLHNIYHNGKTHCQDLYNLDRDLQQVVICLDRDLSTVGRDLSYCSGRNEFFLISRTSPQIMRIPAAIVVIRTHNRPKNHVFPPVYTPYLVLISVPSRVNGLRLGCLRRIWLG